MSGPGTIDRVAAEVRPGGKIKGRSRREMGVAFTLRATLLMTLMPEADAPAVMAALLGDLPGVPWKRPWLRRSLLDRKSMFEITKSVSHAPSRAKRL
jgi:hypothetical protein